MKKNFFKSFIFTAVILCLLLNDYCSAKSLKNNAETAKITGKIVISEEGGAYLVHNWKSRSKKTYTIKNENLEEIKKLEGKTIEAECEIIEQKAWSGTVTIKSFDVVEIEKTDKPLKTESENVKTKAALSNKPLIQIALLLDTSNSMDGLIDQAKSQLWKIVNELASAKKNGISPDLNVSLFEYGKSVLPSSEGYIGMLSQFTTDLDLISDELFKLRTNGGAEYCGWAIKTAVDSLEWSKSNGDLKLIFIAGNEPFNQAQKKVDFRDSCKSAINKSIIVNTIFCGSYSEGVKTHWKEGADLADGKYINIDHNQVIAAISAPQDTEILKLNAELNSTYIGYGAAGEYKKSLQSLQDKNAASINGDIAVQRVASKSKIFYKNESWDLVDAYQSNENVLTNETELPDEMKKKTPEERKKYIEEMKNKRTSIQNRINKLSKERDKYAAEQLKNNSDKNTLDSAIIKTISEVAKKKQFEIK